MEKERARQSFKRNLNGDLLGVWISYVHVQGESLPGWAMTTSEERAIIGVVM